ncbi:hypothetical protein CBR_g27777 [Chara braunii]|uniref:Coiled-coil domain-containing protein SCD2 n=1 Tax=Chara braunii TaxID=69332 RepID=A0A388L8I4_CHABU|nr:hypothetical protein CBR_g27777 [Chara braunii]|eukprot:GBG78552.1 hypothetical protein CBR_g27777 [Chara braunii]
MAGTGPFGGGSGGSGSRGTLRKGQNTTARAAAARVQKVMASTGASSPDDEDDDGPFSGYPGYAGGLPIVRTNSPMVRSGSGNSLTPKYGTRMPAPTGVGPGGSVNNSAFRQARTFNPMEVRVPERPASSDAVLDPKGPDRRFSVEPPMNSASSTGMRDSRFRDDGSFTSAGSGEDAYGGRDRASSRESVKYIKRDTTAALQDEIDLLHEENEFLMEKLRIAEEKLDKSDERNSELRRQIASLGEGITVEARMLSRKEAALKMREEALRVAKEQASSMKEDEIAALRLEAESAREDANAALQEKQDAEAELKALRVAVQRMALTQDEMEEVVLKRCWLARYWGLAKGFGIYPAIAPAKHDHWSSLAPLPWEVVWAAAQKIRDQALGDSTSENGGNTGKTEAGWDAKGKTRARTRSSSSLPDVSVEGNIESMLMVEKGLRELASLKVEEAVLLAMSEPRRRSMLQNLESGPSGADGKLAEQLELSEEEVMDAQFKEAWLVYFWGRSKQSGVELDIAEERLVYWSGRMQQKPTPGDVVDDCQVCAADKAPIQPPRSIVPTVVEQPFQRWSACLEEPGSGRNPPSQRDYLNPHEIVDLAFFQDRTASENEDIEIEAEEEESSEEESSEEEEEEEEADEEETPEEGSYSEHSEGEQSEDEEEEGQDDEEEDQEELKESEYEGFEEEVRDEALVQAQAQKREEIAAGKRQLEFASAAG